MVMEREEGQRADAVASRLATLIEPGSLLEATPECLVVAHADGRILFANHRVEQLTGFDRSDLVGQSVELLDRHRHPRAGPRHAAGDDLPHERAGRDPRGDPSGNDRGAGAVARGLPPRRVRSEGRTRGAVRGRGEVPGTGRADPGGRLPGPGRRELGLDLREPAGGDAARDRPGRVAHRSVLLAQARASRGSRPGLGGVRGRLQPPHHPHPRVPDGARGRFDPLGVGTGLPDQRRARQPVADPGRDLRHQRPEGRRGTGRVPGLPRQAHRPAEPRAVRGDARERHHASSPARPRCGRPVPGPGQLQARERLAGPPRRRRAAAPARRTPEGLHARDRHGGAPGRRRVPAPALGPGAWRRPDPGHRGGADRGRIRGRARPRGAAGALQPERHGVLRQRLGGDLAVPAGRPRRRDPAEERRRRDVPVARSRIPAAT